MGLVGIYFNCMDTRIKELLNNIKSGVNKANTISYIMEEPYDPSSRPEKYPFSCNYMIGINIGSYGNTNTTLGHGDIYIYIDIINQSNKKIKLFYKGFLNLLLQTFYIILQNKMKKVLQL